ncbi:MAG: FAD-dependent monooxygenase [Sphingobium sp.]|nr:FAD-dependent monooxygenase [Sphingobium sp.]
MGAQQSVVVVGAGPVGFLTALGLAQKGVDVTVIDSEPAVVRSPRAAVYFHTTLAILDKLGLLEEADAIGYRNSRFAMHWPATGDVIRTDMRDNPEPGQRITHNLHFGQHLLAELVMAHLLRLPNARVRFGHRLTGLEQSEDGVRLSVDTAAGPTEFRADWVIGSDGARSTVRRLLGLAFEGHTWPDRFVATNIEYDFAPHGFEDANMVVDPVDWAVIAKLGRDNLWRVTYGEDARLDEAAILERLPERFARILPPGASYRIDNFSPYSVHERCATHFRVGRVLLAGDAAHACNPCGGLGLTTGVIDADALIAALGAVIMGEADESVLDFYARERRRVFLEVTSPLASNFKRMLSETDPARQAADKAQAMANAANEHDAGAATTLSAMIRGAPMPV